jgi:hypothetical protein
MVAAMNSAAGSSVRMYINDVKRQHEPAGSGMPLIHAHTGTGCPATHPPLYHHTPLCVKVHLSNPTKLVRAAERRMLGEDDRYLYLNSLQLIDTQRWNLPRS